MSFEENIESISFCTLFAGIVVILLTINNFETNGVLGKMFGYGSIFFSILILLLPSFVKLSRETDNMNPYLILFKIYDEISPFILFLAVIIISIVILSMYYKKITSIVPSDSFTRFSIISSIFVIAQSIMFFYSYTQLKKSMIETAKLRLLSIVNLMVVFTTYISLEYLTTDG
jgi:hypothetical protein